MGGGSSNTGENVSITVPSKTITGNNSSITTSGITTSGPITSGSIGSNLRSARPRPKTHVANATGLPIRVYYNVDMMVQNELVMTVGPTVGNEGGSASVGEKMKFIPGSHIDFLRIPENSATWFAAEGTIYTSVYMEGSSDCDECVKTISENFKVCCDRSYIVAEDDIRLQKSGQDIWMDEDGIMNL